MEDFTQFIQPELLVVVPVLYLIGTRLKRSPKFQDEKIPVTLGILSIVLCTLYVFSSAPAASLQEVLRALFVSVTQGILCAGASVYIHHCIKQERAARVKAQEIASEERAGTQTPPPS